MSVFHRYVAIGDSSTEGLEDPDGQGGYRGWADRLAQHVADGQSEPLEYANLAIRGLRMAEIRMQFDPALALEPDLMTIFGGVNDVIAMRCDFAAIRADYAAMFAKTRQRGSPWRRSPCPILPRSTRSGSSCASGCTASTT